MAVGVDLGRLLAERLVVGVCVGVRLCALVSFVSLCRAFAFGLF